MKCIRPTKFTSNGMYVSCGQCMACRITRRTEWLTKLYLEYISMDKKAVFVTLTYAPEHLPDSQYFAGGNLVKDHLQKFVKRFRHNYDYEYGTTRVRYFGVGEYGERSSRAHYHLIIYNVDPLRAENMVKKSWTLGHTSVTEVNLNRLKYVCQYTIKKLTNIKDFPDGRQPEFTLMSRKPQLGFYAMDRFAKSLVAKGYIPAGVFTMVQRYFLSRKLNKPIKEWNGWFKAEGVNMKLDRPLRVKLMRIVDSYLASTLQTLDYDTPILPQSFKAFKARLTDDNFFDTIQYLSGDEFEENCKKEAKIRRQAKEKRLLSKI